MAQHISRKELKKDEIRETLSHGAEAVLSHRKIFGTVITVAVFVVAAILAWRWYTEVQTIKAAAALDEAMNIYRAPIRGANEPATPGEVTYLDPQNKFQDAAKKFDDVARKYPRTRPGQAALYYYALSQENLGQFNQAAEALKKLEGVGNDDFASLGRYQLAEVDQKLGKSQDAIALYRQLESKPTVFVPRPLVLLSLGDALVKTNPQEAAKVYNQIKKDYGDSIFSEEADKRLESLNPKT